MSLERAAAYLRQFGREGEILEFPVSSATVELAAQALHCEPALIAKTLSFMGPNGPQLIVLAGDKKLDNKKYKALFQQKAKMLHGDEVESLIGHAIGGVCPFGVNEGIEVYLDSTLQRFDYVYPACGSSNSAIKLTPQELLELSKANGFIDIAKEEAPASNAPAA